MCAIERERERADCLLLNGHALLTEVLSPNPLSARYFINRQGLPIFQGSMDTKSRSFSSRLSLRSRPQRGPGLDKQSQQMQAKTACKLNALMAVFFVAPSALSLLLSSLFVSHWNKCFSYAAPPTALVTQRLRASSDGAVPQRAVLRPSAQSPKRGQDFEHVRPSWIEY